MKRAISQGQKSEGASRTSLQVRPCSLYESSFATWYMVKQRELSLLTVSELSGQKRIYRNSRGV